MTRDELDADEISRLRSLTLEERGEMILSACRSAALIEQGRIESGLGPSQPLPWPRSTLAFLKKHAPNGKR
jgi:hypothetical protein